MAGLVTDELNKFGPFGKYNAVTNLGPSTSQDFSSGSLGAAAFIVSGSKNGHVKLARGGTLGLNGLVEGQVYEIGIAQATVGATTHLLVLQR